jgi:hypothetical protein
VHHVGFHYKNISRCTGPLNVKFIYRTCVWVLLALTVNYTNQDKSLEDLSFQQRCVYGLSLTGCDSVSLSIRKEIISLSFKSCLLMLEALKCIKYRQKFALQNSITGLETGIPKPCFVRANSRYAYCHGRLTIRSRSGKVFFAYI